MSAPFNLATFLPYRLAVLSERVSRRLSVEYDRSHGLAVAEWRVLVNLQHVGTASVRDIQAYTNLEKSRVSRAVARLETAGLVRKQTSKEDARLVAIALTDEGAETLQSIIPAATEIECQLLSGLSEEHRKVFFDVVEHFHRVLDADPEARTRLGLEDLTKAEMSLPEKSPT